ncbi:MAG: hypothetical protein LBJ72_00850, partial [Dysgonamonadaceae bacterium]|nr:hypothetical protein [Dysgonamonadaceae bacterium]
MRILFFILLFAMAAGFHGYAQNNGEDTVRVKETYIRRTPVLKVLKDFETKYGMTLRYDSAALSGYTYEGVFFSAPVPVAFGRVCTEVKGMSCYIDSDGIYCVVPTKNLPRNRTNLENKRYEGDAS